MELTCSMSDDVREVKSRLDIADVIGDYVQLRRAGNTLWGLCPFHREKTPSFSVSRERQSFHCFGCNKGGDVITFVMEQEGLSFREALELLAARAGVTLSKGSGGPRQKEKVDRRAILEEASTFFKRSLLGAGGEAARAYLARREVSKDAWDRFEIGWGPASWSAMLDHLTSLGYSQDDALNAGLAAPGNRGAYDRFRGRVIFPVRDEMGRIAGFGGRLIDGDGAKYVNSPEGDLFNKRKLLYFLHEAKKKVRENGRMILMEGYMDVLRAHMSGFAEAVASLGTALTEDQAALMKRFTDLCYIVYDADAAGQEAALRGMYILQNRGVEVRVASLPEGKDPDDVLRSEGGTELFAELLRKAQPLPLYHAYMRRKDLRSPGKQLKAREDLLDGLSSLPLLDVSPHIANIAKVFGVLPHELQREIDVRRREKKSTQTRRSVNPEEGIRDDESVYIVGGEETGQNEGGIASDLECIFCSLLWQDAELRANLPRQEYLSLFADEAAASVVAALLSGESPLELESRWRAMGEDECLRRIARGDAILAREGLTGENRTGDRIGKLTGELRAQALRRRYDLLRERYLLGEITDEERREYAELARGLKGKK